MGGLVPPVRLVAGGGWSVYAIQSPRWAPAAEASSPAPAADTELVSPAAAPSAAHLLVPVPGTRGHCQGGSAGDTSVLAA